MDNLSILAASGLRSRMESLDLLANNLANASNAGFKSDRESYSLYVSAEARDAAWQAGQSPVVLPVIESNWTDLSQGDLTVTGRELDVALSGKGFFVVQGPNGPLLTRDGAFRLSANGVLVTKDGYALQAVGGQTIAARPGAALTIRKDGTVLQDGQILGRLEIADSTLPSISSKRQGNYFLLDPRSLPTRSPDGTELLQGSLETSNVSAASAAVKMVNVLRQFESLQKALQLSGDMNRSAISDVASPA